MKHSLLQSLQALLITAALSLGGIASAQSIEATSTTITSDGTVSEFGPQGLIVRTSVDTQPVRYISTDTTNYVDINGNPVSAALVTAGTPITVYYTKVGDRMIVSKVMVRNAGTAVVPTATTVTTVSPAVPTATVTTVAPAPAVAQVTSTEGVISDIGTGQLMLRSDGSATPVPYAYTKTTTYVDEAGAPIAVDTVRSGVPVTVYYSNVGGALVASKVVVRRAAVVTPRVVVPAPQVVAPPAVETRRTTTTTTDIKRDEDDDDDDDN